MRARPETILIAAMSVFALTGLVAVAVHDAEVGSREHPTRIEPIVVPPVSESREARTWFRQVRSACTPRDVEETLRQRPPPDSDEGLMYEAACYALAGRVDLARSSIERLSRPESRSRPEHRSRPDRLPESERDGAR